MDGAVVFLSICVIAVCGLVGWRWWLDEQTKRATAVHAHALEMRAQRLELDTKDLDELRAKLGALQQDVKALQFGGMKR